MDEHEITRRLRAAGEQPVPDAIRAGHLHRIAMTTTDAPRRFGRLAVAGAAAVGFFAGSTGLAMAGALPDPAQDVAHDVLAVVQVDVPEGSRGACVSAAAKDPALDAAEKKAAKEACRQQAPPGHGRAGGAPGQQKPDKHADDPCRGKPPWAGAPAAKTPEARAERQAQKDQFRQQRDACPDTDAADAQQEAEERQREEQEDAEERRREEAEEQQQTEAEQQPAPEVPQPEATPTPPVEPDADQSDVPPADADVDAEEAPLPEEG